MSDEANAESSSPTITPKFSLCGPNSTYVKLVSGDQHEFFIPRRLAEQAETIRDMLKGPIIYESDEPVTVTLRDLSSATLQRVCHYLAYLKRYGRQGNEPFCLEIPTFDIAPELAQPLLMAAAFLKC